ncbi:heavy metal translocating P-type ATPase [Companilactobacillus zhongbaensis]|uniref:heavy metal translocating P-type ATPase n=1 Tax=Companilactobacillus zhongbaensis TaxID=2486009 RepID=UPI000F79E51D|nr:heavy metal translocating P-type ATPase [Companilactobacillus zhongbaensis]
MNIKNINTKSYFLGLFLFLVGLSLFLLGADLPIFIKVLYLLATLLSGYHVMYEGFVNTVSDTKARKKFSPNIHLLMSLAAVGAILIGKFSEAALLILIFAGAHFLEEYAEGKSKREITKLLEMNPDNARIVRSDGSIEEVSVDTVQVGDTLQVQNGAQIPIDGTILSGIASIDESAINGESIPREKTTGDNVFAGTINGNDAFTMTATKTSDQTVFSKILSLVDQSQNNLSKTATKIKKIEPIYVTSVLILFPLVMLSGAAAFGWSFSTSLYRGIVFLISASPCALAASAVPATLSAISNLAKNGVLFKGGSYLSNLADLRAVAFDKTGTLTKGKPEVTDFILTNDVDKNELINIITSIERQTNHPLASAIVNHFPEAKPFDLEVETKIGTGVFGEVGSDEYLIAKPKAFNNVDQELSEAQIRLASEGKTVVFVAKNDEVVALLALMDTPNSAAQNAINYLNHEGIETVMITGDSKQTGEAIGHNLGIKKVITEVLPEDKVQVVNELKSKSLMTGMVGDGVNDAPALVNADIGVAMGDGTDVAIDVADVVLMKNDLNKFVTSHRVSKRLNKIVWQNIAFSMLVVSLLVVLNFFGLTDIGIGVVAHEGSTLLVILNGLRLLRG